MESWAIVVGINRYPQGAGQPQLQGAVADACDFADWALDKAGGDVAPERLLFWTHPWPQDVSGRLKACLDGTPPLWDHVFDDWAEADKTRPPTAREIVRTAERIGRRINEARFGVAQPTKTRILVFVAGHGLRTSEVGDTSQQTCFVAGDFRALDSSTAEGLVPCNSLRRSLRKNRFDEVLLFLDCCRNDIPLSSLRAMPLCDTQDEREAPQWSVGNAAGDNKRAYETVAPPYRGAFSQTLMDGLRTCRDRGGGLAIDGLERYVRENIARNTSSGQMPQFYFEPRHAPLVIVPGTGPVAPVASPGPLVRFQGLQPGSRVFLKDGNNQNVPGVDPLIVGADPVQLGDLPDGLYSLEPEDAPDRAILFKQPRDRNVDVIL